LFTAPSDAATAEHQHRDSGSVLVADGVEFGLIDGSFVDAQPGTRFASHHRLNLLLAAIDHFVVVVTTGNIGVDLNAAELLLAAKRAVLHGHTADAGGISVQPALADSARPAEGGSAAPAAEAVMISAANQREPMGESMWGGLGLPRELRS
jgi:hypothetical protein